MQKQFIIPFVSQTWEQLSNNDQLLITQAQLISNDAYAPYSKFQVGCALRLEDGSILRANNQENASYPCGSCAERSVLFYTQANHPDSVITDVAIAAQTDNKFTNSPLPPCGLCRQALLEAENRQKRDIRLLLFGLSETFIVPNVRCLLPFQFDAGFLSDSTPSKPLSD